MKWFRARRPIQILCFTLVGLMLLGVYLIRTTPVYAYHPGTDQSGNCTPSEYHIHGQNHGGVIGTEGKAVTSLAEALEIDVTAEPDFATRTADSLGADPQEIVARATQLPPTQETAESPTPVVILVVDDFQNAIYDGSPHGSLVLEILYRTLDELKAAKVDISGIMVYPIDVGLQDPKSPPESHYNTVGIADQIDKAVKNFEDRGIYRFIINMSFGVMPCHMGIDTKTNPPTLVPIQVVDGQLVVPDGVLYFDFYNFLEQHNRIPVLSIPEYIDFLNLPANQGVINPTVPDDFETNGSNNQSSPIGDLALSELLAEGSGEPPAAASFNLPSNTFAKPLSFQTPPPRPLDPLHDLLRGYVEQTANTINGHLENSLIVIPVASAGNFGGINDIAAGVTPEALAPSATPTKPPPLEPASWPEVIAVSASVGDGSRLWASSNAGELMALGGWYKFYSGSYNVGTSFSAPVESSLIALFLSQHSDLQCSVLTDVPLFSYPATYENHSLPTAVSRDCP